MAQPTQMKALLLRESGFSKEPSDYSLENISSHVELGNTEVPVAKSGQVLIRIKLAAVNPADVSFIKGLYGQPREKGKAAGFEGVGEVVESGGGFLANRLKGKRVAFIRGRTGSGTWAEYAVADANGCISLMENVRDEDGAAMVVNPLTAMAMFGIVKKEGADAFVLTAGASQLCKLMITLASDQGYRPIAIVRRAEQVPLLQKLGAAHVLVSGTKSFDDELAAAIAQEKPRIFLDAVTGALGSRIFKLMPRRARWIIYGRLDPSKTTLEEPGQLIFMAKSVEGFWLSSWMRRTPIWTKQMTIRAVQKRFAAGQWQTEVNEKVKLVDAIDRLPEAWAKPDGKAFIMP